MEDLPTAVLLSVLSFVGDAQDFRACEKTCKTLYKILRDDELWALCEQCKPDDYPDRKYLKKELALIPAALARIKKKREGSVIEDVLGISRWKSLVNALLPVELKNNVTGDALIDVRGDASCVLLTIVEKFMISQLARATLIAVQNDTLNPDKLEFPTVTIHELQLQSALLLENPNDTHCAYLAPLTPSESRALMISLRASSGNGFSGDMIDDVDVINNVVCHLSWRAGNAKLDNEASQMVWAMFILTIQQILERACSSFKEDFNNRDFHKSYINATFSQTVPKRVVATNIRINEAIRSIPPYPRLWTGRCCMHCRKIPITHTIVPKQVEDAAKFVGITNYKVYDTDWHVVVDRSIEKDGMMRVGYSHELASNAFAEALAMYDFLGADDGKEGEADVEMCQSEENESYDDDDLGDGFLLDHPMDNTIVEWDSKQECDHRFVPSNRVQELFL